MLRRMFAVVLLVVGLSVAASANIYEDDFNALKKYLRNITGDIE